MAGRVALVTGGTRGIGAAISRMLKLRGYNVAANYAGNDVAASAFKAETGMTPSAYRKQAESSGNRPNSGIGQLPKEIGKT